MIIIVRKAKIIYDQLGEVNESKKLQDKLSKIDNRKIERSNANNSRGMEEEERYYNDSHYEEDEREIQE